MSTGAEGSYCCPPARNQCRARVEVSAGHAHVSGHPTSHARYRLSPYLLVYLQWLKNEDNYKPEGHEFAAICLTTLFD